ncbi:hypothetical protein EW026_g41 [Hermanssonia centrifuga]|uniref:protein-tyrosine-phosphatase n=1 Tax=Hermanssonia centrifuga TaxID=98765 RepID=A0A4S4KVX5_9APHY|nr:hypothetical protein EW026_g41 [Hermanssonia centrifuga]
MKKLSLTLPSAESSTASLLSPLTSEPPKLSLASVPPARRRPSVISLPSTSTASTFLHRKDEDGDGSPTVPYLDGPIQVLPGIWLGNEDNARDWRGLMERRIKSVLNVAKEVTSPFDAIPAQSLRSSISTPDLKSSLSDSNMPSTYYPAHVPSGRPNMHYLKLAWSHGQVDLVTEGFPAAMTFVDQALERGDGVLIHCQCGVSRSATLVIALVMRAAATRSPSVPPEVWALKGMQGAYSFVKEKSKWVGPNMSLIYQLLDYERSFRPMNSSPTASEISSVAADEEEWGRRRQMMEDADTEDNDRESVEVMREARALDKAMEDRRVARKSSISSIASSSSGVGMGQAWRSKYGSGRKRTGSAASIITTGSVFSEHLVEEEEEEELLGVGGGFTDPSCSSSSSEPTEDELSYSQAFADADSPVSGSFLLGTPKAIHRFAPPSAPAHKSSFSLPPEPLTAIRTSFQISPRAQMKHKTRRRPPPLVGLLPPVPSSPVTPVNIPPVCTRTRTEGRKLELPPTSLRGSRRPSMKKSHPRVPLSANPSQTLFVFPPSPTLDARTPSTMTLTSNSLLPFPAIATPRLSTFKTDGRRRSFIGIGAPATPTTASSRVDARGWIGLL